MSNVKKRERERERENTAFSLHTSLLGYETGLYIITVHSHHDYTRHSIRNYTSLAIFSSSSQLSWESFLSSLVFPSHGHSEWTRIYKSDSPNALGFAMTDWICSTCTCKGNHASLLARKFIPTLLVVSWAHIPHLTWLLVLVCIWGASHDWTNTDPWNKWKNDTKKETSNNPPSHSIPWCSPTFIHCISDCMTEGVQGNFSQISAEKRDKHPRGLWQEKKWSPQRSSFDHISLHVLSHAHDYLHCLWHMDFLGKMIIFLWAHNLHCLLHSFSWEMTERLGSRDIT